MLGHFKEFSMKILTFRGGLDFFGPKMATCCRSWPFKGPKSLRPPFKSQFSWRIPWNGPRNGFSCNKMIIPRPIYSSVELIVKICSARCSRWLWAPRWKQGPPALPWLSNFKLPSQFLSLTSHLGTHLWQNCFVCNIFCTWNRAYKKKYFFFLSSFNIFVFTANLNIVSDTGTYVKIYICSQIQNFTNNFKYCSV